MKPKLWVGDQTYADEPSVSATVLHEQDDNGPQFTGLYNADGEPLYREREPIGFRRR